MYKPDYRITDRCLALIENITELTAKINEAKVTFPLMARLQREALSRNAHSSTSIEGNALSLAQVSALSENRDVDADLRQKKEVANYIGALRWILKNFHSSVTEKRLLKLHKTIAQGLMSDAKAGRYKTKQNYVVNGKGIVIYAAPGPQASRKLFRDLIKWIDQKKDIHPIIVSAVFHHNCVSIHPFSDGNGRFARAVSPWVLYKRGFDPQHILSLDDYYAQDRQKYYDKIQQARGLDYDLTYWIEYVAEGISETLKKMYFRVSRLSISSKTKVAITPKQEELLEFLKMHGALSSPEIGKWLKINRARVHQLISPLIKAKIVIREGRARATRYYLGK